MIFGYVKWNTERVPITKYAPEDDVLLLYRCVGDAYGTVERQWPRLHLWSSGPVFHVEEGVRRIFYTDKRQRHGSQLRRIRGNLHNGSTFLGVNFKLTKEKLLKVQFNGVNQGRCGECGDEWSLPRPRSNDEGGLYGTGIIGKTYKQGSVRIKYKFIFKYQLVK